MAAETPAQKKKRLASLRMPPPAKKGPSEDDLDMDLTDDTDPDHGDPAGGDDMPPLGGDGGRDTDGDNDASEDGDDMDSGDSADGNSTDWDSGSDEDRDPVDYDGPQDDEPEQGSDMGSVSDEELIAELRKRGLAKKLAKPTHMDMASMGDDPGADDSYT